MFIGFIGVPGVGKSTLATALAKHLNANLFIEPGEASWPIHHDVPWQQQVTVLENWVRETNHKNFQEARSLANAGKYAVADAGLFLINRELINAKSAEWYYAHMHEDERKQLHDLSVADWQHAPCPDVMVLLETDIDTWRRFLAARGRSMDADDQFIQYYPEQQALIAAAARQIANDRGMQLISFTNQFGAPEKSAAELAQQLKIY